MSHDDWIIRSHVWMEKIVREEPTRSQANSCEGECNPRPALYAQKQRSVSVQPMAAAQLCLQVSGLAQMHALVPGVWHAS